MIAFIGKDGQPRKLSEIVGEVVELALWVSDGDVMKAARSIGITRATLYKKARDNNIDIEFIRRKSQP